MQARESPERRSGRLLLRVGLTIRAGSSLLIEHGTQARAGLLNDFLNYRSLRRPMPCIRNSGISRQPD